MKRKVKPHTCPAQGLHHNKTSLTTNPKGICRTCHTPLQLLQSQQPHATNTTRPENKLLIGIFGGWVFRLTVTGHSGLS